MKSAYHTNIIYNIDISYYKRTAIRTTIIYYILELKALSV